MTFEAQQKLINVKQLAQQKQISQAIAIAQEITSESPNFADAWYTSAFLFFQNNQINKAIEAIGKARKLEPNNMMFTFQEMMMYDRLNRPDRALALSQQLTAQASSLNPQMTEQVAHILEVNEDAENALKLYTQLGKQFPNHAPWLLKQATMHQNIGNIQKAKELCNQALNLLPNQADGHFLRSHLSKQSIKSNHIDQLQSLTQLNYASATEQAKIYFSLAKELEDCQRYEESFEARKIGANIYRKSFHYDLQSDLDFMRQIQQLYTADFVNQKTSDCETNEPIFIVGLPRSGTTLLDRIITSHNDVSPAGELKQLNQSILKGFQQLQLSTELSRIEMVNVSLKLDFSNLGKTYLQTSRTKTGKSPRFTDKFPQNSYYVGMILKAMPHAKIIIMQRHPVAVCYAVYKQLFGKDSYPFSYDLQEMAAYYNQHNKLLKHWQNVGGNAVKTVFYEDLVNDLENQAQDILNFLDLPWQSQCLDFHNNRQPTSTASASQVRQKLYTSSVEMWRHYEQQLQPLIKALDTEI